jgi:hypothetical protein
MCFDFSPSKFDATQKSAQDFQILQTGFLYREAYYLNARAVKNMSCERNSLHKIYTFLAQELPLWEKYLCFTERNSGHLSQGKTLNYKCLNMKYSGKYIHL